MVYLSFVPISPEVSKWRDNDGQMKAVMRFQNGAMMQSEMSAGHRMHWRNPSIIKLMSGIAHSCTGLWSGSSARWQNFPRHAWAPRRSLAVVFREHNLSQLCVTSPASSGGMVQLDATVKCCCKMAAWENLMEFTTLVSLFREGCISNSSKLPHRFQLAQRCLAGGVLSWVVKKRD